MEEIHIYKNKSFYFLTGLLPETLYHLLTNVEIRHSTVCVHTTKLHPTNGCGLSYESEPNSQRRGDGEQIIDVTI